MATALLTRPVDPISQGDDLDIEAVTRREFIIGAAAVGVLLASSCSSEDDDSTDDTSGPTRIFSDARGVDVAVPQAPQKVVFLDEVSLVNARTLGFPVDRIAGGPLTAYDFSFVESKLGTLDIVDTGIITELNFEALLALAPDLVVASLATGIDVFEADIKRLEAAGLVVAQTSYDTATLDGLLASAAEVGELLGIEVRLQALEEVLT
jgi:ABC-type Fe3+-hydroxamate transport system substrate-binding protein